MSIPSEFNLTATLTEVASAAPVAVPALRAALDCGTGARLPQAREHVVRAIHDMNGRPDLAACQAQLSQLALQMQREIDRRIWSEEYHK